MYERLRGTDYTDPQDSIYSCGECHVHAIAAALAHGGDLDEARFLVIEDHDEIFWEDSEDPDNYEVVALHVYSIHETPYGRIARDVMGDRLVENAEEEASDVYECPNTSSYECSFEALMELTGEDRPLEAVSADMLNDAMIQPSVTAAFIPDGPSPGL